MKPDRSLVNETGHLDLLTTPDLTPDLTPVPTPPVSARSSAGMRPPPPPSCPPTVYREFATTAKRHLRDELGPIQCGCQLLADSYQIRNSGKIIFCDVTGEERVEIHPDAGPLAVHGVVGPVLGGVNQGTGAPTDDL